MAQVSKKTLNVRGKLVELSTPRIMGILNATPDSFFAGSRIASPDALLEAAGEMIGEGASLIDVGGYSTRPGASKIDEYEETDRVLGIVEPLAKNFPSVIISVDTFRSKVARTAVEAGAHIINDVSGGSLDEQMFETVAELGVPYVLMHMRGTPETMSGLTGYEHLVNDILSDLKSKLDTLRGLGVADVLIDPGFGFAKTAQQNFKLMNELGRFHQLNCPLLVGVSRKGMIYKTLGTDAEHALNGTTVLNTLALERGVSVLRVHDVKPAVEAVKLWKAVMGVN